MVNSGSAWESFKRELVWRHGDIPQQLGGIRPEPGNYVVDRGEYLLRGEGFACHYRPVQGITVQLDDPAREGEMKLYLAGSVAAAAGAANGLMPVHASAVQSGRGVVGFCGPSGAGKSTLAAALQGMGLALVADDTLMIDPAGTPPLCMPGHRQLKLWPEGMALAGAGPGELVSQDYPKYFVGTASSDAQLPQPLAALVMLERGRETRIEPLAGARKLAALDDDHHARDLFLRMRGIGREAYFALLAQLAGAIPVYRFTRPFEPQHFARSLDFIARWLADGPDHG